MFKTFISMFQGKGAPKPHDVAEAVTKLVGQSRGNSAIRTVVGAAYGSDNEAVAPVQAKVVEAWASVISKKSPDESFRGRGVPLARRHLQVRGPNHDFLSIPFDASMTRWGVAM